MKRAATQSGGKTRQDLDIQIISHPFPHEPKLLTGSRFWSPALGVLSLIVAVGNSTGFPTELKNVFLSGPMFFVHCDSLGVFVISFQTFRLLTWPYFHVVISVFISVKYNLYS